MQSVSFSQLTRHIVAAAAAIALSGCAAMNPMPSPQDLIVPTPIQDSSGAFVSPYTQSGDVAGWVQQSLASKAAEGLGKGVAEAGGNLGTNIATNMAANLPGVGGLFGSAVAQTAGKSAKQEAQRQIAILGAGGWDNIRESSDLSFNSLSDLAIYMYAKHSTDEGYTDTLSATQEIYPDLVGSYTNFLKQAPRAQ